MRLQGTLGFSAAIFLFTTQVAHAHEMHLEEEYAAAPITKPHLAKSIIAYLDPQDVDVYDVLVTPEDLGQAGALLMTANALPSACQQYRNFYPSTALVGYGLPPVPTDLLLELPFEIPPGQGAVVVPGYKHQGGELRPIYTTTAEEMNVFVDEWMGYCKEAEGIELGYVDGAVSYFLPLGLTQECLHCTPWLCPTDGSLVTPIFLPGIYRLYVFNTWSGRGGDYNLSIGTGEEGETCEAIRHTLDIYQGIVDDEVMVMPHCVEAGESDFVGCGIAPY